MDPACVEFGVSEFGCTCITWGLYLGYFLAIVAVIALIALPTMNALKAPKELLKSGAGIALLLIVFLISYALSGDEVTLKAASYGVDASSSKLIGAGLIMFYIVFVASMIGLFYSFINKALK